MTDDAMNSLRLPDSLLADLRHALRTLPQQRGFFAASVLTLALAACALPIWRAARMTPLEALRDD